MLGGLIAGRKELVEELKVFARHAGPALSPFNSWVLSKSLETLALRMDKHCQNALKVAEWLHAHPEVDFVKYPFHPSHPQFDLAKLQMRAGGGVLSFQIKGGLERGRQLLDSLKMASLSANLGDSRTKATHPASTTHRKLTADQQAEGGITPGLIRISVWLTSSRYYLRPGTGL